jgi:serine/threonine-protein kinase HipA
MSELLIVIEGNLAGQIRADKSGRLSLNYESNWHDSPQGYALSVSMPLAQITYAHKAVWPYLWNLLPENPNVLQRWGQQYHVSANNPFKLLTYVGADVPGAAQLIPPEWLEEIRSAERPTIEWMSIDELAERLRQLRADIAAVRLRLRVMKLSLMDCPRTQLCRLRDS